MTKIILATQLSFAEPQPPMMPEPTYVTQHQQQKRQKWKNFGIAVGYIGVALVIGFGPLYVNLNNQ